MPTTEIVGSTTMGPEQSEKEFVHGMVMGIKSLLRQKKVAREPEGSSTMNNPINTVWNYAPSSPSPPNHLNQTQLLNIPQLCNSVIAMVPTLINIYRTPAQTVNLDNNAPFIPQQNIQTPIERSFNSLNYGNNDRNNEQYHRQESTFNHTSSFDLRRKLELLRRKRSRSESFGYNVDSQSGNKRTNHVMKDNRRVIQIVPELAPAASDGLFVGNYQTLTIRKLKTLMATNPESKKWLIVVETDIILENYTYLDDMVTEDPNCQLVVPHHVLSELKTYVSGSSDVRDRRTLRFLTEKIVNGMVILGEPEEGTTSFDKTMSTCFTQATTNNVVILLSKKNQTVASIPNRDI